MTRLSSPITTEFSSDEPSAWPAAHRRSTSFMKPKVRARAISRRKVSGVDVGGEGLAADGRALEIDLDLEAQCRHAGWNSAQEAPLSIRTGFSTRI